MVSLQHSGVGFSIMPINPKKKMCKVYKVIVVGDSGVGKSRLLRRMADAGDNSDAVANKDYLSKMTSVEGATPVKVQLWDTAGQEKFGAAQLASSFFRHADAALVVYDVTNRQSFVGVLRWVLQLQAYRSTVADSTFSMILVGNKCDVANEIRQVDAGKGCEFAKLIAASHFFECSSKGDTNIQMCFNAVAADLVHETSWTLPNVSLPNVNVAKSNLVAKTRGLFKFAARVDVSSPTPDTTPITASRSPTLRALSAKPKFSIGGPFIGTFAVLLSMPLVLLWLDDDAVLHWAEAVGISD